MGGGGGATGKIGFPTYLEDYNSSAIRSSSTGATNFWDTGKDLWTAFGEAWDGGSSTNPYGSGVGYDPTNILASIDAIAYTGANSGTNIHFATSFGWMIDSVWTGTPSATHAFTNDALLLRPTEDWEASFAAIAGLFTGWNYNFANPPVASEVPEESFDSGLPSDITLTSLTAIGDITVSDITLSDVTAPSDITVSTVTLESIGDVINAAASNYEEFLEQTETDDELARFRAGMRDLNMTISSAFVLGQALIEDTRTHSIERFYSDLALKAMLEERKLQYESANRKRELDLQEDLDKRAKILEIDMDERRLALQEDLQKRELTLQEDIDKRAKTVESEMDGRRLALQEDLSKREILAKLYGDYAIAKDKISLGVFHEQMMLYGLMVGHALSAVSSHSGYKAQALLETGKIALEYSRVAIGKVMHSTDAQIEAKRVEYVMEKEYQTDVTEFAVKDRLWDLNLFQPLANMMAAPSGGTALAGEQGPSKVGSAIGGGLAGAGVGASVGASWGSGGGGYGAAIGAGIGAIMGAAGGLASR